MPTETEMQIAADMESDYLNGLKTIDPAVFVGNESTMLFENFGNTWDLPEGNAAGRMAYAEQAAADEERPRVPDSTSGEAGVEFAGQKSNRPSPKTKLPHLFSALIQPQYPVMDQIMSPVMNSNGQQLYSMEWSPDGNHSMMPIMQQQQPQPQPQQQQQQQTSPYVTSASPMMQSAESIMWMQNRIKKRRQLSPIMAAAYGESLNMMPPSSLQMATYPSQMAHQQQFGTMPPQYYGMHNMIMRAPKLPVTPLKQATSTTTTSSKSAPLLLPFYLNRDNKILPQGPSADIDISALPGELLSALSASKRNHGGAKEGDADEQATSSPSSDSQPTTPSGSARFGLEEDVSNVAESFLRESKCINFEDVTVIEMKNMLRKYGVDATGKKATLIERIKKIVQTIRERCPVDEDCVNVERASKEGRNAVDMRPVAPEAEGPNMSIGAKDQQDVFLKFFDIK